VNPNQKSKGRLPVDKEMVVCALRLAQFDAARIIKTGPYTLVVVNRPDFPTSHWTKKLWQS